MFKRILITIFLLFSATIVTLGQCAMCRTTIVNNVSHGETTVAAYLNMGILYLFFTPYILVAIIGYFWYRNSKFNEKDFSIISRLKR